VLKSILAKLLSQIFRLNLDEVVLQGSWYHLRRSGEAVRILPVADSLVGIDDEQ
jgi:hypothetical protein